MPDVNHCGSCTACCKVYSIPELYKPAGRWCEHCAVGSGCVIYDARPKVCQEFECVWLQSQKRGLPHEVMPPELRPDRCKVVIAATTNPNIINVTELIPGAAKKPRVHAILERIVANGLGVAIGLPGAKTMIGWTRLGRREVRMTDPDPETGIQYSIDELEQI